MRCLGLNKNYKRCSNKQKLPFCRHHYLQPIGFILFIIMIPFLINLSSSYAYDKLSSDKTLESQIEKILIKDRLSEFREGKASKNQIDSLVQNSEKNAELLIDKIQKRNTNLNENINSVEIPIKIRIINQSSDSSLLNRINLQVDLLNTYFNPNGIRLTIDRIENINSPSLKEISGSQKFMLTYNELMEIADKYSKTNDDHLNLFITDLKGGMSYSGFPFPTQKNEKSLNANTNYIFLESRTMPEGNMKPYNEGKTMFDAIGHWLGLYHTFMGGCEGDGDFVADTPAHQKPMFNAEIKEACKEGEFVPVHNYMNYVPDSMMNNYTRGQMIRMKTNLVLFRNQFVSEEDMNKIDLVMDDL